MVVGNGLVANAFKDIDDKYIIFASGVSNSSNIDNNLFDRERQLIMQYQSTDKTLIYFSSIFSITSNSPYFEHKRNMENLIIENFKSYYIFRMPQIIGYGGNPNNIINLFVNKILDNDIITIWKNSKRSIIDIKDVVDIVLYIIKNNQPNSIYNVSGIELMDVNIIVDILDSILLRKSNISLIDKDIESFIPNSYEVDKCIDALSIGKEGYTEKILRKYVKYK
jgi:nucleoside-diphosphate-sugar epimerase